MDSRTAEQIMCGAIPAGTDQMEAAMETASTANVALNVGDTIHVKTPDEYWTVERVGLATINMSNAWGTIAIVPMRKIEKALGFGDIEIMANRTAASTEDTMELSELTLIERYRAPQYLVDVIGDCDGSEVATVAEHGYEVIDTDVKGWGSHNAIIRTDWADYLATLVER